VIFQSLFHPAPYTQAFAEAATLLGRHRRLLFAMVRRDMAMRHAGQIMGKFWVFGHPLLLMALFVFVFGVVFDTRLGGSVEFPRDYTVYILSGLVPWLSTLPALTGSCNSITGNAALVKQFVFHVEILPAKDVFMASVIWGVGMAVVAGYTLVRHETLPWTYLLLPVVLAFHVIGLIGLAFFLSATTVFVRDLKDLMVVVSTMGIYVLPVTYLPEWVPTFLRPLLYVNPLSYVIWVYQDVLYFGRFEHPLAWAVFAIGSSVVFAGGYRLFRRLKPMFGNAL
jgi:lipopolysaccharide transport system permease protein